jgi:hypothetical protein
MFFLGVDWGERHHDLCLLDQDGTVLAARRITDATAKGRKAFAGTDLVTRSSGLRTTVVARAACNQRLVDACYLWAFAALSASPGARRCYDATAPAAPPTIRRYAPWATGWSGSCTAAWPAGSPTRSSWPGRPPKPRLELERGAGGAIPRRYWPLGSPRGSVVQVGQRCREVKRDGTAEVVRCVGAASTVGGGHRRSSAAP